MARMFYYTTAVIDDKFQTKKRFSCTRVFDARKFYFNVFEAHILLHLGFSSSFLRDELFLSTLGSRVSTHVKLQCTLTLFQYEYVY